MARMSPSKAARRRLRGIRMLEKGIAPTDIARELDVSRQSVYLWKARLQSESPAKLAVRRPPGRRLLLNEAKLGRLYRSLMLGPVAHGFPDDRWTLQRIADLIYKLWGLRVSQSTVSRYLDEYCLSTEDATVRARKARLAEVPK